MDNEKLSEYVFYLQNEERSENTIAKYARDLRAFFVFRGSEELTKAMVLDCKGKTRTVFLPKDLSRLADLLGHSSVNTTKIYTMESGKKHAKQLDRMGLILAES